MQVVTTMKSNASQYDWQTWRLGVMRSFISGGSSAMVSAMTGMGIAPDKFNFTDHIGNFLKLAVAVFLFQGGYRMFEFLSLHAAPDKLQTALQQAADASDTLVQKASEVQNAVKDAKDTVGDAIKKDGN